MSGLRKWAKLIARTPLHPQWLLGTSDRMGKWVRDHARGQILDIGCADRWIQRWLSADCRYLGLDYPPTGKLLYGAQPHLFADASSLPLVDQSVDTVILLEVMEHLRAPNDALREVARVLRPDGRLLFSMPFLYPVHDAPHDYQRLTVHGLVRDVEIAGLQIESVVPTLGSAETAGLIASLALGGMAVQAIDQRRITILLVPIVALAILIVNLISWIAGILLPPWYAVTSGYRVVAISPKKHTFSDPFGTSERTQHASGRLTND